ncbi:MAG: glycosyltransferase [Planctomycetota bacterium]
MTERQGGLSVVIPALVRSGGDQELLERAIRSARRLGPDRITVVDDASPTPIRVDGVDSIVRFETNRGPSAARNAGIDTCEGTDVVVLDADDEAVEVGMRRAVALLREQGAAMCAVGRILVQGDSEKRRDLTLENPPVVPAEVVLRRPEYFGGNVLLLGQRAVEAGLRFDESLRYFEDTDICLRASGLPGGLVYSADVALRLTVHEMEAGAENLSAPKWFANRVEPFARLSAKHADTHRAALAHLAHLVLKQGVRSGASRESLRAHMRTMRAHGLSVPIKWRVRAMLATRTS